MIVRLVQTCGACPEQYDAFIGDRIVGYLRLRHGYFYVECPDCGGSRVYESRTKGDGIFDEDERDYHLRFAVAAIERWVEQGGIDKEKSPDVAYEIVYGSPKAAQ
jgi:hypothetical protein